MMSGTFLVYILLFAFGTIIGSFLNVVILRFGTGLSVARGRSKCFSCGKTLEWYELIPLVSFLLQAGKCRSCGVRISRQYPLVEFLGGVALILAYLAVPLVPGLVPSLSMFVLTAILLFIYIVIWAYDVRHKIIPDAFSYSAAIVALSMIGVRSWAWGFVDWYAVIAGPTLFLFFFVFWYVSRGRWMGLGDGKLALSVGWALGMAGGVAAVLYAFWIGAIISLLYMAVQKTGVYSKHGSLGMKSEIPFGPYIIIGFLLALVFPDLFGYVMSLLAV